MKASRIILLLVALIAGGLAAYLATRGDGPVQVVEGPTQVVHEAKAQILVAKTPIGVGQRLTPDTIEWQDWPQLAVRPEYVTVAASPDALTEMSGAVARFEFFPGEPILEQKLVRTGSGYLSAVLAKGMRGVSIDIPAGSAAGGYIIPNDRVDVVLSRAGANGAISEVIVSNVKVLAIGTRLGQAGTTGAPADPADPKSNVFLDHALATLELNPAQADTVINGGRLGTLSLVLRSIVDFAAPPEALGQRTNQSIRIIRYGVDTSVMSNNSVVDASANPAAVDTALPVPTTTITVGPGAAGELN